MSNPDTEKKSGAKKPRNIKSRSYPPEAITQINDDFSFVSPADGKTYRMTLKERTFCETYLEFKGDGVDAIMEVYDVSNPKVAAAMSYEYLRKPHLFAYINSKLEEYGFNDENVLKQHLFLLNQDADLKSKAKAVEMFYKLKGMNAPEKSANVNINITAPLSPKIKELADKLNK